MYIFVLDFRKTVITVFIDADEASGFYRICVENLTVNRR